MVVTDANRQVAIAMYRVALGMVMKLGDEDDAEVAHAALITPNSSNCRALLSAGRGKPWEASIRDALCEIGIAGADEVFEGYDHET